MMLISESFISITTTLQGRHKMISKSAMSLILFSFYWLCLSHCVSSSTIQEDIDKFLRNDLLLYISKDGIESANLESHHQLDQFQDFSVLRQPLSPSSLVYDDNIKEESTSRLASTETKSNSLLKKTTGTRVTDKHLAEIPNVTSIKREQFKRGPVGAHSRRPSWPRLEPSVAVGVSFGLRTKPLLRSTASPPVGIPTTTTARPFLLKTNNERSVKPISTTTTVPVTEEIAGPVDLDYLDNSEDNQRSQPIAIGGANNDSNRFDWDNLWTEESQQSSSITRVNKVSDKEDDTLGLNLPKYQSQINFSSLFGDYKSPTLSFDPFKLYDEQSGQKNPEENAISEQSLPVKFRRIVTETRLGDTQHLATYRATPDAGSLPSGAMAQKGHYQSQSSPSLSANVDSTDRVVGTDPDRHALPISDGLQAKGPALNDNKVSRDSTSWIDRPSLAASLNPNPVGHISSPLEDSANTSAYDRNFAYEYMKSLLESPDSAELSSTLKTKSPSANSTVSQPSLPVNSNSIGNFGNRLNINSQPRPDKSILSNYVTDYKLSDEFYQPKPIPDRYLSKPFRGFANQINKQAASYDTIGDLNRLPPTRSTTDNRPSMPLDASSKWKGIPSYSNRLAKSSHDTAVRPIVTSIVGRNQSNEIVRLIPQASVETVPLPPRSEYDQPEIIHAGDYVVRVEKVPVKNLQDAYYNPEIPGESTSNSSVSSATLQSSDDSSTESSASDNEVDSDSDKKSNEDKSEDEDKKTEDSSGENESEREDTTTTSTTTEKPDSEETSSEDTGEDKESTSSQEDDNASGEDNSSSNGNDSDDKDDDSDSDTTTTTTPAPSTTTTTTPKPSPPPYPPYPPMFPPPFMFPPMYPPMPPPMYASGNGVYPPPMPPLPPMPYPMPPPLYMPYGPHIYRPNYGSQAKPPTGSAASNGPYRSPYSQAPVYSPSGPYPIAPAPVPPQQPYPAAPQPNKPYYPNPNSISYTPFKPPSPSSGAPAHYKPLPPVMPNYPQQKYPMQPHYPGRVPNNYPQKSNYPPNNYQNQYTNEITKTISISSDSPKNEYYQYYRRDDNNQYPPTQGVSSYQQSNINPTEHEQTNQYQMNQNLPYAGNYPAIYQEPKQYSARQGQYGENPSEIAADLVLGDMQKSQKSSSNHNLKPQALNPVNYATQSNYEGLIPVVNSGTYASQASPHDQVTNQYSQPNIQSTVQSYANPPQQNKQSKFSFENIKKGFMKLLPKLRYTSGDPYPPELDIYYRPLTGTFDPNDPMEDFWNHINKENQAKPPMYNCDHNRVGKCVMTGISPSQPFPSGKPVQELPQNPVFFQSGHMTEQSFQPNQAFHTIQPVNQQFDANQAAVQPKSQFPMSQPLQSMPFTQHNQFPQTQSQSLQQQSAASLSPTLVAPVQ